MLILASSWGSPNKTGGLTVPGANESRYIFLARSLSAAASVNVAVKFYINEEFSGNVTLRKMSPSGASPVE